MKGPGQIYFFKEQVTFAIRGRETLRNWLKSIALFEDKIPGSINFIFCDDEYLLELNQKYLKSDTLTDVIAFNNSDEEGYVSADIFISVPSVRENAEKYKTNFQDELHRVMAHGILHIIGYKDKTKKDKVLMTRKENYYLALLPNR
ncbi:MAG: rRNA maturation RNase YbeY [Bacteroidetes bacterium]|nr:rRNA maturation RNase YbeY [Bacteroidota bacterium]